MRNVDRKRQPVRIYRVGGSVRDELLGRTAGDRDWVVVGATPEIMIASGFRPVGRDFPVFLHPETHEEHALARTERKHGRGYRGFEFFASPEVTLEDDLRRRDLTINAIARADDGTLIDPFGGAADLAARVLRHVSPSFAEDPLRVLRVARFAARFDFRVAPKTMNLMRTIAASGELAELSAERIWQEFSTGLSEPRPSRMLKVLRRANALAQVVPEVDALHAIADRGARGGAKRTLGDCVAAALDRAAAKGAPLPARYAILAMHLGARAGKRAKDPPTDDAPAAVRRADAMSVRLRVPVECRDAARLAARWHKAVRAARELPPSRLLAFFEATDALRRPGRLDVLLAAIEADAVAGSVPVRWIRDALAVVRAVDAAAIARREGSATGAPALRHERGASPIGVALRAARLAALRSWKRANRAADRQTR